MTRQEKLDWWLPSFHLGRNPDRAAADGLAMRGGRVGRVGAQRGVHLGGERLEVLGQRLPPVRNEHDLVAAVAAGQASGTSLHR